MEVIIESGWKDLLKDEFDKGYFIQLAEILHQEKKEGKTIYPPGPLIFNAFKLTPLSNLKVVIIGQDPYHNPNQANGLSFSVPDGVTTPPSLINIYKELRTDLGVIHKNSGNLEGWAKQGVFLLNAALTVRANQPASHAKIGWNIFTDAVIKAISDNKEHIVFMLWGNYARGKSVLIDHSKHLILEAAHPSPLARGAFFGCKHFSKCNTYLKDNSIEPIDWSI